ncbi:MAG: DUF134 domain-containing protein, partial [Candidatus ainarchaeum sp.]|nr:DUF134 domain-containing protein [Candidatus ainarchaeum sp.]
MPRKRRMRSISNRPSSNYFKPAGIPLREIEEEVLSFVEIEAIRLKDFLGLEQKECAERMNISQPTFHRLLIDARKKISSALVNGKAIKLEDDNNYYFE